MYTAENVLEAVLKSEGEQELEDDYSYFCSGLKTCTLWQ